MLWIAEVSKPNSFADASRNYLCALSTVEYADLYIKPVRPIDWRDQDLGPRGPFAPLQRYRGGDLTKISQNLAVIHHAPTEAYKLAQPGKKNIALTVWESSLLPADCKFTLNYSFDEVWVPCTWNKAVFEASGVKKPIYVMPHALGPVTLPRRPTPSWRLGRYVFYYIGAWNERKNPEAVLRAFLDTFGPKEPVALILKAWTPERWDDTGNRVVVDPLADRVRRMMADLRITQSPPVVCVEGVGDESSILQLHDWGDCYVSAHRAEGFGLALARAKQLGRKVIATGYSGPLDFLDPAVDTLLPYTETDVFGMDFRKGFTGGQKWAEPDFGALKDAMRAAFDTRAKGSPAGMERNAWPVIGDLLKTRLAAHA